MDTHLKHRLVGALVVISLAVIVSPLLFDFSGTNRIDRTSQVPPRPNDLPGMLDIQEPTRVEDAQAPGENPFVPSSTLPMEEIDTESSDADFSAPEVETSAGQVSEELEERPLPEIVPGDTSSLADEGSPILDEQNLPNAWVIQIGAFAELEKAEAQRDQLVASGWKAYFSRPVAGTTDLYKVLVGPFVDPAEANQAKAKLDTELGMETWLTKFEP